MVQRFLEQKEPIRLVLGADRKTSHLVPTWQDIDVIQSINAALEPLKNLTDLLSGETYVTVSAVMPIVHLIENDILKEEDTDSTLTGDIKRKIRVDLRHRYSTACLSEECINILNTASFLDPRFKDKYMSDEDVADVEAKLELDSLKILPALPTSSTTEEASNEPPKKKRNLGSLFKSREQKRREDEEVEPVISPQQKLHSELQKYKAETKLDFEGEALLWWKLNCSKYSILSQLARKYLCICATSASSERVFSTAGNVLTPLRAHLTPDKVEMLTFLSKNL